MRQARLPPAFHLVTLPGSENPRTVAGIDVLPQGELADGVVLWRESGLRLDCVFVVHLEAGETGAAAIDLMLAALADALGSVLPPTVPLHIEAPATILLDGSAICRIETLGEDTGEGGTIGLALDLPIKAQAFGASLFDFGAGDVSSADLLEALARHLLNWASRVDDEGPRTLWANLDGRRIGKPH